MIEDLPNLFLGWSIQVTGVLSPGPAVALLLGIATAEGRRPALTTCFGIALASFVLAALTVAGLAVLLAEIREVMIAVRLLGAGYLAWLAWGAFRKAAAAPPPPQAAASAPAPHGTLRRIAGGFVLQIGNPKAILFWIAIAAVGALETISTASLLVFLAGAFVISFAGHGGWAVVLSSVPFRRLYAAARRGVEATLGTIFAMAALRLVTARD